MSAIRMFSQNVVPSWRPRTSTLLSCVVKNKVSWCSSWLANKRGSYLSWRNGHLSPKEVYKANSTVFLQLPSPSSLPGVHRLQSPSDPSDLAENMDYQQQ
ncbi:hypothetical protein ATANTOWER_008675 [Ataeniobius toweri]|uniref:Uncharacterized protein n=1 Tax=Ataeniobius toweri TaxID=208326 RepID=A0ABU7C6F7_9TELE|nr:hypothetical protein [Ataeniobius toweri]